MKLAGIFGLLVASKGLCSVFTFSDINGYRTCLKSAGNVVESSKEGSQETHRYVDENESISRCVDQAVAILKKSKDVKLIASYIEPTRTLSDPKNAIAIIEVLVGVDKSECNQMKNYEILMSALEMPMKPHSFAADAAKVVKLCLTNKQFQTDFKDEASSQNQFLKKNACSLLKDSKVAVACK